MFNFSTLTSGDNHVGKEINAVATAKSNTNTSATIDQHDTRRGEEAFSDAKHASTTTDTKEKITSHNAATISGINAK